MRYRLTLFLVLLLSSAGVCVVPSAQAQTRCATDTCVIHLIWDVGKDQIFIRTDAVDALTAAWAFPARNAAGGFQGFGPFNRQSRSAIQRGDVVRLHLTNYNSVSHKPLKGQTAVITPDVPVALGVLAAFANVFSGGVSPSLKLFNRDLGLMNIGADPSLTALASSGCAVASFNVSGCLDEASDALTGLSVQIDRLRDMVPTFKSLEERTEEFPDSPGGWAAFDNSQVLTLLNSTLAQVVMPTHATYDIFVADVDGRLKALAEKLFKAGRAVAAVDAICAALKTGQPQFDPCAAATARRDRVAAGITAIATQLADDSLHPSESAAGLARYQNVKTLVGGYRNRLDQTKEAAYVADADVTTSAPDGSELVFEMPFGSYAKDSNRQIGRRLRLVTDYAYPAVFPSVGAFVMWPFNFQEAVLVEQPNMTLTDVNKTWATHSSGTFLPAGAILMNHIRLGRGSWRALYGSIGTTADKNIFNNLIVGGSIYFARARTVLTFSAITARGSSQEDIEAAFAPYNNADGFAIGSTDGLPDTRRWHWRPLVGVSVKPF